MSFVHTQNLPTRDAGKAIRFMIHTANNQNRIKARAGGSARGRKLGQPVYCYSLSWAPDEEPSQDEMIEAAQETLEHLDLEGHEVLMVAHHDEPHPHIHLIVNRVHPDTGIAAPLSNDHLKLSRWAEEYEKRQGQIRCEQRVINNERRRRGAFVKDRASQRDAAFYRWRRERVREVGERRQHERDKQASTFRDQLKALYEDKEQKVAQRRDAMRRMNRIKWRALYLEQEIERDRLQDTQRTVWARLRNLIHNPHLDRWAGTRETRAGFLSRGFATVVSSQEEAEALDSKHDEQRAALARRIKEQQQKALREINEDYRRNRDRLKADQAKQREDLEAAQTRKSKDKARAIKEGKDREEFRKEERKKTYSAFRELRDEATRERGGKGRERDRKGPGSDKDRGEE